VTLALSKSSDVLAKLTMCITCFRTGLKFCICTLNGYLRLLFVHSKLFVEMH